MGISLPLIALGLIVLLAAGLRFANLSAIGEGNLYYAAAIKAMLQSSSNFFFVAAEPGGSVSVDKPPLGLWIQAVSATIFGVNGFAVVLPEILSGLASIVVLYYLVRRYLGAAAGLIAALVLAITPVSIAAERNNTMDASLIQVLLLAAWAFVKATDSGKLRWLILGGVLVGLGFNIKMMQAFLPLPAFYSLYFFGAKTGWLRKIGALVLTTAVLLAVSLSWAIAVDLTPASQRPYVGGSTNNSVMNLIIGYNGTERLFGGVIGDPQGSANGAFNPAIGAGQPPPLGGRNDRFTPLAGQQPPAPPGDGRGADGSLPGGGIGPSEIGEPGVFRLFITPLANEISWLLPVGLAAAILIALGAQVRLPLATHHQAAVLWGGWLLTEVVFFSVASFFHAYYLAMLAPPLAALVGTGVIRLWQISDRHRALAGAALAIVGAATLAHQLWVASQYNATLWWFAPPAALAIIGAVLVLMRIGAPRRGMAAGSSSTVAAIMFIPALWSGLTTLAAPPDATLPHAYNGSGAPGLGSPDAGNPGPDGNYALFINPALLTYLKANTQGIRYLAAVPSSLQGAPYVLETGRPVLYIGGFIGQDKVVDAESLQELVDAGQLRYVLWGGRGGPSGSDASISAWLQSSCNIVTEVRTAGDTLYQCSRR